MDIFFQDPSEIPLPPEEVRIRELRAEPWPDGQRVHVYLEVDPFQKRPSADVRILGDGDRELASISIIETMVRKMEFTMHLRGGQPGGTFRVTATLFYTKAEDSGETQGGEPPQPDVQVVDTTEATFKIEG